MKWAIVLGFIMAFAKFDDDLISQLREIMRLPPRPQHVDPPRPPHVDPPLPQRVPEPDFPTRGQQPRKNEPRKTDRPATEKNDGRQKQ